MGRHLLRHRLGGGFGARRAYDAVVGDRTDSVWLDSGDDGVSWIALGEPVHLEGPVIPALRAALAAVGEVVPGDDAVPDPGEPRFRLGLVGWLGYELRGETTGAAVTHAAGGRDGVPARMLRIERAVGVDGRTGEAVLLALGDEGGAAGEWPEAAAAWRDATATALAASRDAPDPAAPRAPVPVRGRWHDDAERYLGLVRACQDAIREGEAYQLCLTTEIEVETGAHPLDVYARLRASSPTHHGALLRIGGTALLSASPERFLAIGRDGTVATSPIKGTRRRGVTPEADAALAAELLASEKERAENVMIVDLMRNDLSRVCDPATVEVTSLLAVESYAQVHQLVSTVRGRLRDGVGAVDAVAACFPAGSMTGAPKRRATEILDALEDRARGPYAGVFGYLGADGAADLAMTIRTIVLETGDGSRPGRATIGTGGGITALSAPGDELEETAIKAAPLLAALGARAPRR